MTNGLEQHQCQGSPPPTVPPKAGEKARGRQRGEAPSSTSLHLPAPATTTSARAACDCSLPMAHFLSSPSPFLLPPELLPSFSPHLQNALTPSGPPSPHAASSPPFPLSDTCTVIFVPLPLSSTGAVRASSIFPILSVILLFMGGLCIAASEFYKTRHNIILSAGIFFVSAGNGTCAGRVLGHGWAVFPSPDEHS